MLLNDFTHYPLRLLTLYCMQPLLKGTTIRQHIFLTGLTLHILCFRGKKRDPCEKVTKVIYVWKH